MLQVNFDVIQKKIDTHFIDPTKTITIRHLVASGILGSNVGDGVKLLARGTLKQPIDIEVTRASEAAIEKVEKLGGSIATTWYNQLGLRALIKPYKFDIIPKRARPPPKYIEYYTSNENRGYLSPLIQMRKLGLKYEPVILDPKPTGTDEIKASPSPEGKKKKGAETEKAAGPRGNSANGKQDKKVESAA